MSKTNYITRDDNFIDSRELMNFIEFYKDDMPVEEMEPYLNLAAEFEDCAPDYLYGEMAIRHDYFVRYCIDLVNDAGYIPEDLPDWIGSNINWEGVADELMQDYAEVDFDGVAYYVRSV